MPNERCSNTSFVKELLLKWQDNGELADRPSKRGHAVRTPRPELRSDVVENRHTGGMCETGETEVEAWVVNQDDEVVPPRSKSIAQGSESPPVTWEPSHDLYKPEHRRPIGRAFDLHASMAHGATAHSFDAG